LRQAGYLIDENRVTWITRRIGLKAQRAYRKLRFRASLPARLFPNVLERQFIVHAPNRVWVSDNTCDRALRGSMFLTLVADLLSPMVVG